MNHTGDVVYLSTLGNPIVVLGSYQAANDLLQQRGQLYSDRPRLPFVGEMYALYTSPRRFKILLNCLLFKDGLGQIIASAPLFTGVANSSPVVCSSHEHIWSASVLSINRKRVVSVCWMYSLKPDQFRGG